MSDYLVQFNNISKFFGKVIALKDVTMKLKKGEIMCLLGDNGAGKSTLIKTLAGVHRPCLLYTSPSPRDRTRSRMPSSA